MDAPRFELYSFWRSSAVHRIRVACNLKGISPRERNVDIEGGEHRGAGYLALNPMAGIPALVDHAADAPPGALTQSLALLEFLDELHPQPPLLPPDPHGRARVRSLALMLAADTHPLITPRIRRYLTTTGGFDDAAWRAWQVQWFTTGLQAYEKRLATDGQAGDFSHGDSVTTADICLASIVVVTRVFKITVPDIPTVDRIMARCEALDAFARADPMRQAGAPKP